VNVLLGIIVAIAALIGLSRGAATRERIVPEGEPDRRAELTVAALLLLAAACAVVFIVAYVLDWPDLTQYLGLALGGAFGLLSIAFIIASKRLVVTEEIEEDYPDDEHPDEQQKLMQIGRESAGRITRKRLLGGAAGAAASAIGAAIVVPAVSLGPLLDTESFYETPWRRGGVSSTRAIAPTRRRTSRRAASTPPIPRAPIATRSARRSSSCAWRRRRCTCRPSGETGRRRGSSPTRRSARTRDARSRCTASRCSRAPSRAPRSSAPATTRRSTRPTAARSSSGRPGATCPSSR
jgi:hypothetical protein